MLQSFNSVLLHDTLPVDRPDLSDILILALLVFNPGIYTTWGIKNNNNNPYLLVADTRSSHNQSYNSLTSCHARHH